MKCIIRTIMRLETKPVAWLNRTYLLMAFHCNVLYWWPSKTIAQWTVLESSRCPCQVCIKLERWRIVICWTAPKSNFQQNFRILFIVKRCFKPVCSHWPDNILLLWQWRRVVWGRSQPAPPDQSKRSAVFCSRLGSPGSGEWNPHMTTGTPG